MTESGAIVFFDGVCGLCNSSVDFLMRRDRAGRLRFAPLQGETATARLSESDRQTLSSMVFLEDGTCYRKSSAVVRALGKLGGIWPIVGRVLWIVPKPIRDLGYSFVARLRYWLFGKKDVCRMPKPEERGRLLP